MQITIQKHPTRDEMIVSIVSEPLKILKIEDQYVTFQWEEMRWTQKISGKFLYTPSGEQIVNSFSSRLYMLIRKMGEELFVCENCGEYFEKNAKGTRKRFCSNRCRQQAMRKRMEKRDD